MTSNASGRGRAQEILTVAGIETICADIEEGLSLRAIAANLGISVGPLLHWVNADPERLHAYLRARQVAADGYADLAQQAIEECDGIVKFGRGEGFPPVLSVDPDLLKAQIAKAKELAAHYRWKSAVVDPRRYGSKLELSGKVGLQALDDEALAAKERELLDKLAEVERQALAAAAIPREPSE